jgi:hypothetical protein
MDNSKNVNFQNVKDSGCSCRVVEQVLAVALRCWRWLCGVSKVRGSSRMLGSYNLVCERYIRCFDIPLQPYKIYSESQLLSSNFYSSFATLKWFQHTVRFCRQRSFES